MNYPEIPYKTLSKKQKKFLEKLFLTQSKSRNEFAMVELVLTTLNSLRQKNNLFITKDKKNNIFVVKDLTPSEKSYFPLGVAHMDTVHKIVEKYEVFRMDSPNLKGDVYTSKTGIGGDDKNGIFILFQLLQNPLIKKLKVLFTVEEEIGMHGAEAALTSSPDFFKDIAYMFEPDRKGNCDIIHKWGRGETYSPEFKSHLLPIAEKYQYKEEHGSVTDVFVMFEVLNISCFNFSCGYYEPHTAKEYVYEDDVKRALDFITLFITSTPLEKSFPMKYETNVSTYYRSEYSSKYQRPAPLIKDSVDKNTNTEEVIMSIASLYGDQYGSPAEVIFNIYDESFIVEELYTKSYWTDYTDLEKFFFIMQFIAKNTSAVFNKNYIPRDKMIEILNDFNLSFMTYLKNSKSN